MAAPGILCILMFAGLAIDTLFVMANLWAVDRNGRFNLDFLTHVVLSAVWIAWRHATSPPGIVLALIGLIGGMLHFALYLIVAIGRANGDMQTLLLGAQKGRP